MIDSYTVHTHKYGKYVTGSIPVYEMAELMKLWGEEGYTLMDFPIAWALKATVVATKKDSSWRWRKELGITEESVKSDIELYEKEQEK